MKKKCCLTARAESPPAQAEWENAATHAAIDLRHKGRWCCTCNDCRAARSRTVGEWGEAPCSNCGKAISREKHRRYCSPACKQAAYRARIESKPKGGT